MSHKLKNTLQRVGVYFRLLWALALRHVLVKGLFSLVGFVHCSRVERQSLLGRRVELSSQLEERNKREKSKKRLVTGWFASMLKP